jgi:BASS family bile acid:Na+ symporter
MLAIVAVLTFGLDRWFEVGVVLMAISPGAPVALRRSLGAGSHRAFAPALQLGVAVLAIVTLPAWIAVLDRWYGGHAWVTPLQVARQVFVVQLLPLGIGLSIRHVRPPFAAWLQPRLAALGNLLLIAVLLAAGAGLASAVVAAGPRLLLASCVATCLAVTSGHLLGGPDRGTRTAVAIGSAARNPGLALLVATTNAAPPAVGTAILAHFLVSALTLVPYIAWRRRSPS